MSFSLEALCFGASEEWCKVIKALPFDLSEQQVYYLSVIQWKAYKGLDWNMQKIDVSQSTSKRKINKDVSS